MKLAFGKIHGDSAWKEIVKEVQWSEVIFYGNYLDGSHHTNQELAKNLSDIINFCRFNKNVTLYLGEHDKQYLGGEVVPGYREDGKEIFEKLLRENLDLFNEIESIPETREGCYYLNEEEMPLRKAHKIYQRRGEEREFLYELIDGHKVGIYSLYGSNIDQKIIDAQAAVFQTFRRNVNQIRWDGRHPAFLDHVIKTEDVDFFVFFDIDAIPLRPDFLELMVRRAGNDRVLGCEQVSVHISDHVFAASFGFCISKNLYERMGRPSFETTFRSDCAQEITHIAEEIGVEIDLIKFKSCEKEHYYWKLPDGRKYGYGSTYEDLIFHNFESRSGSFSQFFIDACEKVVEKYQERRSFYEIGLESGCDKIWAHRYDFFYPRHLEFLRRRKFAMLEIGVAHGQSIELWKSYFPLALIYGMDNQDFAVDEKKRIYKLDQSSNEDLERAKEIFPKFSLIIDDGSHVPEHQIETFKVFFEHLLEPGGTYIIEDIETSFWRSDAEVYGYPVGEHNALDYIIQKIPSVNDDITRSRDRLNISSIAFGRNAIIITKRTEEEIEICKREYRFSHLLK